MRRAVIIYVENKLGTFKISRALYSCIKVIKGPRWSRGPVRRCRRRALRGCQASGSRPHVPADGWDRPWTGPMRRRRRSRLPSSLILMPSLSRRGGVSVSTCYKDFDGAYYVRRLGRRLSMYPPRPMHAWFSRCTWRFKRGQRPTLGSTFIDNRPSVHACLRRYNTCYFRCIATPCGYNTTCISLHLYTLHACTRYRACLYIAGNASCVLINYITFTRIII